MPSSKMSPPSLSSNPAQYRLSLGHLAGQKFLEVETQVIITLCKVRTAWRMLENYPLELFVRPLCFLSCTLVLPSERSTPFPHIPFVGTFTIHFSNPPVKYMLVFMGVKLGLSH
jgi:hypothetical protein